MRSHHPFNMVDIIKISNCTLYIVKFFIGFDLVESGGKLATPCIMCVQYRGGVQYIMSTVGGYLEYRGGVQYRGGYHDKCGGYLEYRGVFSTVGRYHEYHGGYLEYRGGCSVPWGIS